MSNIKLTPAQTELLQWMRTTRGYVTSSTGGWYFARGTNKYIPTATMNSLIKRGFAEITEEKKVVLTEKGKNIEI